MLLTYLLIIISCCLNFMDLRLLFPRLLILRMENLDYARASVDEMVGHIDQLLESLISGEYRDDLPETIKTGTGDDSSHDNSMYNLREILRPTKAAALALRARLWVYAASPLFNGGYQEALTLTNHDGKRLFPDRDANNGKLPKRILKLC